MQPDPRRTAGHTGECLHDTVARLARSQPAAVALVESGDRTTYQQLDRTADAWAALLVEAGVTPGDLVPIRLPRSARLVTALLAVLKTGAAYALLDPTWPAARLREVLDGLGSRLVITGDTAELPLPGWTPPTGPVEVPPGFHPVSVVDSAPCCVFFTSGTTGTPKAVLSPHRAIARLFPPVGFADFTADTVMPLAAPVPWDAFALELWSVLLTGGTSSVIDEPYLSAHCLRRQVTRSGITTVWLTSSLFNMIMDEDLGAFHGLRQVMIGGERLSAGHVGRFLRAHPGIALINGYGPVESTVFATTHRITRADCERPGGIPLGQPVPGTGVHVLDGDRSCAVGETGEICVSGAGLALRYLADPVLTASRFTEVDIAGSTVRVYRTGDLGTWDADGLLHFLGRADRQMKVLGHRIEPAEIERQVERTLPAVRSCRVLARHDNTGAARELLAFCVPVRPGDPLAGAAATLRSALLPHQRPATVVSVDVFPVTAQGKLDDRALLALAGAGEAEAPEAHVESDDDMVRLVAQVFAAVLGRVAVRTDVPFSDLGGNSLDAGRVCARLAARLDRPIPVSQLFEHPSAVALTGWLRSNPSPRKADRADLGSGEVPLTHMQLAYLTRHLLNPADLTAHCLLTWVIEGEADLAALESAIVAVHRRHEPLRAAYTPDPRPVARLTDIGPPRLERSPAEPSVDAAMGRIRTLLTAELDLDSGDVWRTALVPVASSEAAVFGCVVHHIAFDGWSESVLARDLAAAYNIGGGIGDPPPPRLSAVGGDYTDRLDQVDHAAHRRALREELAGVPALRWPAGPVRPAARAPGLVTVELPAEVVSAVDALAATAGVSRFVALLAHYAASLAEVTGQPDFAVGVPVAQRYGAGLERAVGCHITTLPIRMRGTALGGGTAAVAETGRVVARAFAAQDVPFGEILKLVDQPRSDRPPLFQTLFALQDNAIPRLDLTGLRTTFVRQPYLDLPLELHTELWPQEDGGLRLTVYYRQDIVPRETAHEFTQRFLARLPAASGVPA